MDMVAKVLSVYSSHLGALKPRWVNRRCQPSPTPRLPTIQLPMSNAARFGQLNVNNAGIASRWKEVTIATFFQLIVRLARRNERTFCMGIAIVGRSVPVEDIRWDSHAL